jgi:hypothetical protein
MAPTPLNNPKWCSGDRQVILARVKSHAEIRERFAVGSAPATNACESAFKHVASVTVA